MYTNEFRVGETQPEHPRDTGRRLRRGLRGGCPMRCPLPHPAFLTSCSSTSCQRGPTGPTREGDLDAVEDRVISLELLGQTCGIGLANHLAGRCGLTRHRARTPAAPAEPPPAAAPPSPPGPPGPAVPGPARSGAGAPTGRLRSTHACSARHNVSCLQKVRHVQVRRQAIRRCRCQPCSRFAERRSRRDPRAAAAGHAPLRPVAHSWRR